MVFLTFLFGYYVVRNLNFEIWASILSSADDDGFLKLPLLRYTVDCDLSLRISDALAFGRSERYQLSLQNWKTIHDSTARLACCQRQIVSSKDLKFCLAKFSGYLTFECIGGVLTHCFGSSVGFVSACEFITFTTASRRSEWDSTKCFPYRGKFISFVS